MTSLFHPFLFKLAWQPSSSHGFPHFYNHHLNSVSLLVNCYLFGMFLFENG